MVSQIVNTLYITLLLVTANVCSIEAEDRNIIINAGAQYWKLQLESISWQKEYEDLSDQAFIHKNIRICNEINNVLLKDYKIYKLKLVAFQFGDYCAVAYHQLTGKAIIISAPESLEIVLDKTGKTTNGWFREKGKNMLENIVNYEIFQRIITSELQAVNTVENAENIIKLYLTLFNIASINSQQPYIILESYKDIPGIDKRPILNEYTDKIGPMKVKMCDDGYAFNFFTWSQWDISRLIEWNFNISREADINIEILSYKEDVGGKEYVRW